MEDTYRSRVAEYVRHGQVIEVPQDYLRSAELTVEQNYNMALDGLLNNIASPKSDLTDGQTYDELRELAPESLPAEIHAAGEKPSLLGQVEQHKADAEDSLAEGPVQKPSWNGKGHTLLNMRRTYHAVPIFTREGTGLRIRHI